LDAHGVGGFPLPEPNGFMADYGLRFAFRLEESLPSDKRNQADDRHFMIDAQHLQNRA
jgi:hypothetical protein